MNEVFIGTQYYRPPHPRRGFWEEDLAKIKKLGLKLVRAWVFWSQVNPKQGVWDYSKYDEFVDLAEKEGFLILIQLFPESAPYWFIEKHRDALYVDAEGKPIEPHSRGSTSVGGFPGLCPDVPEVKEAVKEFIVNTVKHFLGRKIYAYDVWNELMPFFTIPAFLYHPATQEKFREWLKRKYGTIERLNKAWGGYTYTDWSQIRMPNRGNYAVLLDVHLFHRDWITEHLEWRVKLIKSVNPRVLCASHVAGGLYQVTRAPHDAWFLAEKVDVWGASDYEIDFFKSALFHNAIASSSGKKPWWLSEQTGGRTWTLFGDKHRTPEFIIQKMVQAISYGAKGNIIWQWRPESFGQESPNFGLVFEDGSLTARAERVSRLAKVLEEYSDAFESMYFDEPDVGLVLDWRIRSFEYTAFKIPGKFSENEVLGLHKALTVLGANIEVLSLEKITEKGIRENIKLLVMPLIIQDIRGLHEVLADFVEKGGYLIVGPYFLVYREDCFAYTKIPPEHFQELLGFRRREIYYPDEILVDVAPGFLDYSLAIKGYHLVEEFELTGGTPLLYYGDMVTGALKHYGRGLAYSIGTFLGTPYLKEETGLKLLLSSIMTRAKCRRFPSATGEAVVRLAHSKSGDLLFVFNPYENRLKTVVEVPAPVSSALDLLEAKEIEVEEKRIVLELKGCQAKIILLK